jgi:hypothetical protein
VQKTKIFNLLTPLTDWTILYQKTLFNNPKIDKLYEKNIHHRENQKASNLDRAGRLNTNLFGRITATPKLAQNKQVTRL